jgi:hypothetical protein
MLLAGCSGATRQPTRKEHPFCSVEASPDLTRRSAGFFAIHSSLRKKLILKVDIRFRNRLHFRPIQNSRLITPTGHGSHHLVACS